MDALILKEAVEVTVRCFADSPLGKLAINFETYKPMHEYDGPLQISNENIEVPENPETRPLTDEERTYYKEILNCSDATLDKLSIDSEGKLHLRTINEGLEGKEGENGVRYERKTIEVNGVEIEGVFPEFDSTVDVQLPNDLILESDGKQEKYCNEELKNAIEADPELAKEFTPEQLEQINNGDTPRGYTWHHSEEPGKMQLVKTDDHQANRHTGGRAIWGGGQKHRQHS